MQHSEAAIAANTPPIRGMLLFFCCDINYPFEKSDCHLQ
jgi:hypothetical protein